MTDPAPIRIARVELRRIAMPLVSPFRTSFGWHVAEVMERRVEDMSREFSRQQAENTLRNRKFEVELQNWLVEIREQAYVKISPQ